MLSTLLLLPLLHVPLEVPLQDSQRATTEPVLQRYVVDASRSEVGFHATSTLHDFTGVTSVVTGEIRTTLGHPARLTVGRIRADARTLDSDNKKRDVKMREHLDVEHFPWIEFVLASVQGDLAERRGTLEVTGSFHIHGVERQRTIHMEVEAVDTASLRLKGSYNFEMQDHGVDPPSVAGFINVGRNVEIFLDLVLVPVKSKAAAARVYSLAVTERIEPVDGEVVETTSQEQYWVHSGGGLWMRNARGLWITSRPHGQDGGASTFDLTNDMALAPVAASEQAFLEAGERLGRLQTRLAGMPKPRRGSRSGRVLEIVERLRSGMKLAPPTGDVQVERTDGSITIRLGDQSWVTAEGSVGSDAFGPALLALEGLPASVRSALASLEGVPERLLVRTATPAGVRILELHFEPAQDGHLPDWALEPGAWVGVREGGRSR